MNLLDELENTGGVGFGCFLNIQDMPSFNPIGEHDQTGYEDKKYSRWYFDFQQYQEA